MSAKYSNQNRKKKNNKTGKRTVLWILIAVLAVALIAELLLWWGLRNTQEPDETQGHSETQETNESQETNETQETNGTQPSEDTSAGSDPVDTQPQNTVAFEDVEQTSLNLGYGLSVTDVGKYTGVYMEDGTDEIVSGILMIVVTNSGQEAIQYAKITLPVSGGEAVFTLSTLPAGQSVVLLEQNRLKWSASEAYNNALMENLAVFSEPLSLCEDRLKLQILNGAINVTNISGEDITGDIVIYYKNSAVDLYYGGITYRVTITGGMKAGEIKQIMASRFSGTGSKIMFVTVGQ